MKVKCMNITPTPISITSLKRIVGAKGGSVILAVKAQEKRVNQESLSCVVRLVLHDM